HRRCRVEDSCQNWYRQLTFAITYDGPNCPDKTNRRDQQKRNAGFECKCQWKVIPPTCAAIFSYDRGVVSQIVVKIYNKCAEQVSRRDYRCYCIKTSGERSHMSRPGTNHFFTIGR